MFTFRVRYIAATAAVCLAAFGCDGAAESPTEALGPSFDHKAGHNPPGGGGGNAGGNQGSLSLGFDSNLSPTDIDGNGSDDLVLADPQEIPGSTTGSAAAGDIEISADGTYTLTVTDIAKLPEDVNDCAQEDLDALRNHEPPVLGTPLTGDFSLSVNQAQGAARFDLLDASLDGDKWDVQAFRTVGQPVPEIVQTGDVVEVTQHNAKILLSKNRKGKGQNVEFTVDCRASFHLVAAPASGS